MGSRRSLNRPFNNLDEMFQHLSRSYLNNSNIGEILMECLDEDSNRSTVMPRMMQIIEKINEQDEEPIRFEGVSDTSLITDRGFKKLFRVSRRIFRIMFHKLLESGQYSVTETLHLLMLFLWSLGDHDDVLRGCIIFDLPSEDAFQQRLEQASTLIIRVLKRFGQFEIPAAVYDCEMNSISSNEIPAFWGALNKFCFPVKNGPCGIMHTITDRSQSLFRYSKPASVGLPPDLEAAVRHAAINLPDTDLNRKKIICADPNYDSCPTMKILPNVFLSTQIKPLAISTGIASSTIFNTYESSIKQGIAALEDICRRFPGLTFLWKFSPEVIQAAFIVENICNLNYEAADH